MLSIYLSIYLFPATDLPATKPWQRWVLQTAESPRHERIQGFFNGRVNWTFTYRKRSEIFYAYGFYFPHGEYDKMPFYIPKDSSQYLKTLNDIINNSNKIVNAYLNKKEKGVLWIISNCGPAKRNKYAQELKKNGLAIDKFGGCGKRDPCNRNGPCLKEMSAKYKFYLAFENSQCEEYITEKTWRYLQNGMVPIVMGPSIETYKEKLPPDSFLHVDNFTSPTELVKYIKYLDSNNKVYMKYHEWRKKYDALHGETMHFLWICDMCKKIHDPPKPAHDNVSEWWRPAMCK